jgi:hypothetical protein
MRQLKLNHNGETRLFQADGAVAVIEGGAPVVKGKWRAQSQGAEPQVNQIRYQIDNVDQPPVPVTYSFNEFNQLVSVIPAAANGGTDSEPCAWLGQIQIDDASDLTYSLLNDDRSTLNNQLTVYGKLHFASDTADLVIDLAGGGQATIEGEKGVDGISMLAADKNFVAEFDAQDLLRFVARTRNDFPGFPSRIPTRADIKFLGQWDVDPNTGGLVFVSKVAGDLNKPDVIIGFAGKLKAVTAGFAYFADKNGQQLAFTVQGSHRWNATEAKFELSLGHTDKKFLADFSGSIERKGASGQQFVLGGTFKIKHEEGAGTSLDLKIEGAYDFDEKNRLVFRALVSSDNHALNYDLQLEGKFVFNGVSLNFLVRVSSGGPSPKIHIEIASVANKDELKRMIALTLDIEKDKVKISFVFELRLRFKGGVLIKDKPKEL